MAVQVLRCPHCGREVLVRMLAPMSAEEIARRQAEEMQPATSGPPGARGLSERMRDDIWLAVAGERTTVPRDVAPDCCPACGRDGLEHTRVID